MDRFSQTKLENVQNILAHLPNTKKTRFKSTNSFPNVFYQLA